MDELRGVLHELGTTLTAAVEQARRAGYLARRLGVAQVDQEADCSKVRGHAVLALHMRLHCVCWEGTWLDPYNQPGCERTNQ